MRSRADAAPSWLWTETLGGPGDTFRLDEEAAHHLVRVCRARVGDAVALTDGRGGRARAEVTALRPSVVVRVLESDVEPAPARRRVACGAPEGERADWMIEKLAELGVTHFQPVDTGRAAWRVGDARLARWRRLARAALGQSRSRHLMEVLTPVGLEAWLESPETGGPDLRWVGDPDGVRVAPEPIAAGGAWLGLVGPSPGLDEPERRALEMRGFRPIRLSDRRLRTETAAVAMAAVRAALDGSAGA